MLTCRFLLAPALAGWVAASTARADEGMWLINKPPTSRLKADYGFEPTAPWLEHLQKSAVRFSTGGSGSIVSADGLVMTNHHVGSDMLLKLSTPDHNLLKTGFYAPTQADEPKCPDLELNVLWDIRDVTERVLGAAAPGASPAEANTARRKVMSEIENEAKGQTGLLPQVVTLYQGGKYDLYLYKRYTDVRLVFAPEESIAFYGGDTDNFEYPRYDLDCCFFRIYEGGKPLKPEHHLEWSKNGTKAGELIFVVGHPGRTRRLFTLDHLRFIRDEQMPLSLQNLWRAEIKYQTFAGRSAENARTVRDDLFGVANSRKAVTGQYAGLTDPALWDRKAQEQKALERALRKRPELLTGYREAVHDLADAEQDFAEFQERYSLLESGTVGHSKLSSIATALVRLSEELPKESGDRLREYRDSNLESLYLDIYSPAPIYDELEIMKLSTGLSLLAERLGAEDELVKTLLAGKSPAARAEELVKGTKLKDVEARKALGEGGAKGIQKSKDPLIRLALALDKPSRELRTRYEDGVQAVERESYAKIAGAKFAVEGENVYPDATFTLRLAYGTVKGYRERGHEVPPYTDFAGLYTRAQERKGQEGFELPPRWVERREALNPATPFNFVSTADIIGGNSGSPVVNRAGELVGLIFDGNIQSLVSDFIYNGDTGRAVSVDSRAIPEALRKVYDAGALADELTGSSATIAP
jgi:hypothetical protein